MGDKQGAGGVAQLSYGPVVGAVAVVEHPFCRCAEVGAERDGGRQHHGGEGCGNGGRQYVGAVAVNVYCVCCIVIQSVENQGGVGGGCGKPS